MECFGGIPEQLDMAAPAELESAFARCLESVARRLAAHAFKYQVPIQVSHQQMLNAIETFLKEASGGLRPLAVSAAMMSVLGRGFSLFARVSSQGVNEADAPSGAPGDVMCFNSDGDLVLAVEVKDRVLTLSDIRISTRKARESSESLPILLFATAGIRNAEKREIHESIAIAWASGLNISQIEIVEMAGVAFALLGEEWRPEFLREIGKELDRRGDHAHRRAWHGILSDLADRP